MNKHIDFLAVGILSDVCRSNFELGTFFKVPTRTTVTVTLVYSRPTVTLTVDFE